MPRRTNSVAAWAIAAAIIVLTSTWHTVTGGGDLSFHQPYQASATRFWESRKSARHPSRFFFAWGGQILRVEYRAEVDRGVADLSVASVLGSRGRTAFSATIDESQQQNLAVPITATGVHRIGLRSDLGAFDGDVRLHWRVE